MESCTCGTCRHWTRMSFTPGHGICAVNAIEADAGEGVIVLLSKRSGCWNHRDMWEATDEYLTEVAERDTPAWELNGLQPGIDFPATL